MRKRILIFICIIVFVFSGCHREEPVKEVVKEDLEGKISILSYDNNYDYIKDMAERFNNLHPKVNIEINKVDKEYMSNEFYKTLESQEQNVDIVTLSTEMVKHYSSKYPLSFFEMNEFIMNYKEDFPKARLEQVSVGNNKIMALPWDNEVAAIYYNKELFKKYSIKPEDIKTWEDVIALKQALVKSQDEKTSLISYTGTDIYSLYDLLTKQLNLNKDNELSFITTKESIQAVSLLRTFFSKQLIEFVSEDEAINKLKKQETLVVIASNKFMNISEKNFNQEKFSLGIMELPAFERGGNRKAMYSGNNLCILENSKNKELCKKFIEFSFLNKDNLVYGINKYSILPVWRQIENDLIFDKSYEVLSGDKPWRFFDTIQKNSYIPKANFDYSKVSQYMNDNLPKVIERMEVLDTEMENLFKGIAVNPKD